MLHSANVVLYANDMFHIKLLASHDVSHHYNPFLSNVKIPLANYDLCQDYNSLTKLTFCQTFVSNVNRYIILKH